jgi:ring-1,2-phenylacetyl-CoA epoxidase subunit PaaC
VSADLVLGLGDDALIAAQRLSQWCARAPELEEDIALANIALDQLGAARLLLSYAAALGARPSSVDGAASLVATSVASSVASAVASAVVDEDALAYLRDDTEYRNVLLVELPEGDFAVLITKLLLLSAYQHLRYDQLSTCDDGRLAAIAGKAVKESAYHLEHSALWTVRLGDGTEESHARMQAAVDELWPYAHELFEECADLRAPWLSTVESTLAEATLDRPADGWAPSGGRRGVHTEHLSYLLGEMQVVHRAHPGASW